MPVVPGMMVFKDRPVPSRQRLIMQNYYAKFMQNIHAKFMQNDYAKFRQNDYVKIMHILHRRKSRVYSQAGGLKLSLIIF